MRSMIVRQVPLAVASTAGQEDVTRRRAGSFGVVLIARLLCRIVERGQVAHILATALGQSLLVANEEFTPAAWTLCMPRIALVVPRPEEHVLRAMQRSLARTPTVAGCGSGKDLPIV